MSGQKILQAHSYASGTVSRVYINITKVVILEAITFSGQQRKDTLRGTPSAAGTKRPLPIFLAEFKAKANDDIMKKLTSLLAMEVTGVPYKQPPTPLQCFKCQRFGHSAYYCMADPRDWKKANVTVFAKPGKDPTDLKNYRPISLLNTMGKILEKIILKRLNKFIHDNSPLRPERCGFHNQHSTSHQLLRVVESITRGFNEHRSTGGLFIDIEKAFDRTDGSEIAMYADDTTFLTQSWQPKLVHHKIQNAILKAEEWFKKWRMNVNASKCVPLFFTKRGKHKPPSQLQIYGHKILPTNKSNIKAIPSGREGYIPDTSQTSTDYRVTFRRPHSKLHSDSWNSPGCSSVFAIPPRHFNASWILMPQTMQWDLIFGSTTMEPALFHTECVLTLDTCTHVVLDHSRLSTTYGLKLDG
ncbi:hypothetical protein AAG570_009287 [Ranatra chinensis]|uniref:Reverse transcriptase domain-containing protein n=1 Tax=Ranatra chinensis TaxID=642074 RepID=A0ABD0Z9Q4_9HEMI